MRIGFPGARTQSSIRGANWLIHDVHCRRCGKLIALKTSRDWRHRMEHHREARDNGRSPGRLGITPIKMLHLELPMLTSIKITGLQTYGYHGLFEEERTLGQKFSFDIFADLQEVRTHLSDDLDSSVRYDAVVDEAVQIASSEKFQTLEALGETIAAGLLRRFDMMNSVTVAVAKSSPPIAHAINQVGVQVSLRRAELAGA